MFVNCFEIKYRDPISVSNKTHSADIIASYTATNDTLVVVTPLLVISSALSGEAQVICATQSGKDLSNISVANASRIGTQITVLLKAGDTVNVKVSGTFGGTMYINSNVKFS